MQEIWEVKYKELVIIPGFKPIVCKTRTDMRGGGVGFYIRENLCCNVIEDLSPFTSKIFESITIKLTYPASKKSMLLTCAYRSNGTIHNLSQAQQMESFFDMFSDLVFRLQQTNMESYIFMDANINLLELNGNVPQNYMNLLFAAGYLQGIIKATRIQNASSTLIDHIHFNNVTNDVVSGVIISDISDHFFIFICPHVAIPKSKSHKEHVARDFSLQNLAKFKQDLNLIDWSPVLLSNNVETLYDCFWSVYKKLFVENFPLKRKRFNKNFNARNKFMTHRLIVSRRTKNDLHSKAVANPLPANINRYKTYKTIYQRLIRAAKKRYIADKLTENASNPKKTWQTLKNI